MALVCAPRPRCCSGPTATASGSRPAPTTLAAIRTGPVAPSTRNALAPFRRQGSFLVRGSVAPVGARAGGEPMPLRVRIVRALGFAAGIRSPSSSAQFPRRLTPVKAKPGDADSYNYFDSPTPATGVQASTGSGNSNSGAHPADSARMIGTEC